MASQCRWIPLESNPKVLNKYISTIGADSSCQFVDIYGLDDELLQMIPSPVLAIVLLYPLTDKSKAAAIGEPKDCGDDVYFMRQTIGNACGTVALVHSLANNDDMIVFEEKKHFSKFLQATKGMSPEERGKYLETDSDMGVAHEENAQEGDTEAPPREASLTQHFVAFVNKGGNLYELDGRKEFPVNHGKTDDASFVKDTVAVVKKFMARDPEELNFTLMALCKSGGDN